MSLSIRYNQAFAYAAAAHGDQVRKGSGIPHLTHLLSVSVIVLEYGGDETQAIAGMLHDVIEDQGGATRLAELRLLFPAEVVEIVVACTDSDTIPKPPWKARKEAYLASIGHKSPRALLVVAADKLHNARSILRDVREQGLGVCNLFAPGRWEDDGILWYYRGLADALFSALPCALTKDLGETVAALEDYVRKDGDPDKAAKGRRKRGGHK
jgi:hypothetical protein